MSLQFFFAVIILWTPPGRWLFDAARGIIHKVLSFTDEGASFLFGNIYNGLAPSGATGPVQLMDGTTGDFTNLGLIFAFHILPTVIFFGSLMSVLYHLGIIQRIVKGLAWVMVRTMGTSGSESLSAARNIFVGQTEAPLVVRPFLDEMTNSELMAIMVGGFATVAGGVLAAYTRFGIDPGHLLAASVMSAPAALVVAKILYYKLIGNTLLAIETDENQHKSYDQMDEETRYNDLFMAHSGKWIYIRFNPDKYISKNGKRKNPTIATRLKQLKIEIDRQIKRIENEDNTEFIEHIYMYYDGYS